MRWQKALTKKQMAHLRWTLDGDMPTLTLFRWLRVQQKRIEATSRAGGFFTIACHECDEIERRLVAAEKMEVTK